ncbi:hypothetical protein FA95DRAFT_442523 [Auriscalpium vulgare]|uniref:Uncharacterized protein n=1 Tax=Auriscalpium vulgare TaxID=40419 RepID=A0ACB8RGT6_9AGAM|nr:hypothetical protein FA95DRAFT_442523 [Auriscalpium vulgare]
MLADESEPVASSVDYGPPPFDDADADIIIRSSDLSDFRVLKFYVEKTSPVLKSMILGCILDPDATATDGLPVLTLPETRDTLSCLLSTVLPVPLCIPDTLDRMLAVLAAAQKYEMPLSSELVRKRVPLANFTTDMDLKATFRAYLVAWGYKLRPETMALARMTLSEVITVDSLGEDLCRASGPALSALEECRALCAAALEQGLLKFQASPSHRTGSILWHTNFAFMTPCTRQTEEGIPVWFIQFLANTGRYPGAVRTLNEDAFFRAWTEHVQPLRAGLGPRGWAPGARGSGSRQDTARTTICHSCASMSLAKLHENWSIVESYLAESLERVESRVSFDDDPAPALVGAEDHEALPTPTSPDVILQSRNGKDFYAHRAILSASSPIFQSLFTLPTPRKTPSTIDTPGNTARQHEPDLPVVTLSEDSVVLHALLTWIYPITSIMPTSFDQAALILSCMQKYEMDSSITLLRRYLSTTMSPPHHDLIHAGNALSAYALATSYRLADEARIAAKLTLPSILDWQLWRFTTDLPLLSGPALYALSAFHKRCRRFVLDALTLAEDGRTPSAAIWQSQKCAAGGPPPDWWSYSPRKPSHRPYVHIASI